MRKSTGRKKERAEETAPTNRNSDAHAKKVGCGVDTSTAQTEKGGLCVSHRNNLGEVVK